MKTRNINYLLSFVVCFLLFASCSLLAMKRKKLCDDSADAQILRSGRYRKPYIVNTRTYPSTTSLPANFQSSETVENLPYLNN